MKTFAIFLFVFVVGCSALTDQMKTLLREHKLACITETGVNAEAVENAKKGMLDENDPKLACFAACFLKKLGFVNDNGVLDEAVIRAKAPKEIPKEGVDEIINRCKHITGANACETGAKLYKCYTEFKTVSLLD